MNIFTLCTIFAGVLWGTISVFLKNLSSSGLSLIQITACRAVFSSFFLFVYFFVKDKNLLKIKLKDIWMFVGTGVVSLTFFSLCYFSTILESGASIAVILLYTSPIFILLLSAILFKEKITKIKLFALILTFVGCIFVTGIGGENHLSAKGLFIGLCAGFGYALYSIFSRFALKKYKPLTVTFYTFVFSSISLLPFCNVVEICSSFSEKSLLFLIGIALVCTVLPYIFYTFGLSGLETGKAAILVTVEPLVGSLIGIFVWKETLDMLKLIGIIMIFIAVILINLNCKSRE
ncbi:MAG: EamA family transporter [Treponema bryantii]|nr:EamA family transporter [Treponema bryantii]